MVSDDDDRESARGAHRVSIAGVEQVQVAAVLLDSFNLEFDDPTPGPRFLADRLKDLMATGGTHVLLAGDRPDGVAVMRVRPALWSAGSEAYLEELYVVPDQRRRGLGQALLTATLELARELGCDRIDLGTDSGDADAHRLYERNGFNNFADLEGDEQMLFYERDL